MKDVERLDPRRDREEGGDDDGFRIVGGGGSDSRIAMAVGNRARRK
jgi:hypothetical protein